MRSSRPRTPSPQSPRPALETSAPRAGMIDVDGMIRQASTRVSVDQLIRKGKKFIQVLSREKIDELINRSVKTIVDKHRVTAAHHNAASAARIAADSRAEFEELLSRYQQTADATRAVEQSKRTLEEELPEAHFELAPLPAAPPLLEDVGTTLPGAFEDVVRELDRQAVHVFKVRRLLLDRSESAEAVAELDRVHGILRAVLAKAVDVERGRFVAAGGGLREIATLQKRLEKLLAHVAIMEAALKTLSTAKTFSNQQVQNLLRDLGLAPEDRHFERKKEMLKVVLDANRGIRSKARDLAARGITLDAPLEAAVFTSSVDSVSDLFSRSSA